MSENTGCSPNGLRVVDRDLILRKVADLQQYLKQLEFFRQIELSTYQEDWKTQRIVERTLHLAIETCMDIADHIVADRRLPVPETAAGTFEILGENQILPAPLAASLVKMVGFRNILVHDYAKLDHSIVLRVLRTDLQDLLRFSDIVQTVA